MTNGDYFQDDYLTWTALHRAVQLGDLGEAQRALENGFDPDCRIFCAQAPGSQDYHDGSYWEMSRHLHGLNCAELASMKAYPQRMDMQLLLLRHGATPCNPSQRRMLIEHALEDEARSWRQFREKRAELQRAQRLRLAQAARRGLEGPPSG